MVQMYLFLGGHRSPVLSSRSINFCLYARIRKQTLARVRCGKANVGRVCGPRAQLAKPPKENKATPGDAPTADWPSQPPAGARRPIAAQSAEMTGATLLNTHHVAHMYRVEVTTPHPDRPTDSRGRVPTPEQRLV